MADERYLVLARKWRPQRFEDVVGQEHITRTLKNAIDSGRIHHAFLFIGSRGIGKTTTARILAKALNCEQAEGPTPTPCGVCGNCTAIQSGTHIDVMEIDGASNNSVEDVRELRDNIRMVPTNGRYKVYIIDEVHQLSVAAFNALLKTLEEPPPHAIFILATTEAHRIPATIISRCQRYDFRRVPIPRIIELLQSILEKEQLSASPEALHAIARAAEGGVRDAESILDELITYCQAEITFQDVFDVLGLVDWHLLHDLCDGLLEKDVAKLLGIVDDVVAAGKDLSQFVQDILRYFRNMLVCKTTDGGDLLELPEEDREELARRAERFPLTHLIRLVEQFAELTSGFDSQLAQRIALEALLIRLAKVGTEVSVDSVLEKLLQLESQGLPENASHAPPAAPPAPPEAKEAPPAKEANKAPAKAPPGKRANPPEAGASSSKPAEAPARAERFPLEAHALARGWQRVLDAAIGQGLKLPDDIERGEPVELHDGVLTVRFEVPEAAQAVERPENLRALEAALAELTTNATALRTTVPAASSDAAPHVEEAGEADAYPPATPAQHDGHTASTPPSSDAPTAVAEPSPDAAPEPATDDLDEADEPPAPEDDAYYDAESFENDPYGAPDEAPAPTRPTRQPRGGRRGAPEAPKIEVRGAVYSTANPELARQALEDPDIAHVVDVFKGRIARITPPRDAAT